MTDWCIENDFAAQRELGAMEAHRMDVSRGELVETRAKLAEMKATLRRAYQILVKLETEGVNDEEYAAVIIKIEEALNLPQK